MYRIGIDLGGINIAAGLVKEDGTLLARKSVRTGTQDATADEITQKMIELALALIGENGLTEKEIRSVGIGCPGAVEASSS